MSAQIKSGKRPISQKNLSSVLNSDDIFNNPLALDPAMIKVIESKGHSIRFINFKQFINMGGQHQAHWKPISLKTLKEWGYDTIGVDTFISGSDSDGYVRRQDLVLATRPKDINDKHKAYLRQEASRVQNLQGRHAQDLREYSRMAGLDAKVEEGYEDEQE